MTATGNTVTPDRGVAYGGAIWLRNDGSSMFTVRRTSLSANAATALDGSAAGGGLASYGASGGAALEEVDLVSNVVPGSGGALGGGAWVSVGGDGEALTLDGLTASGNGGRGNADSTGGGLDLDVHAASVTVRLAGLALTDNAAYDASGIPAGTGGGAVEVGGLELRTGEAAAVSIPSSSASDNAGDGLRIHADGTGGAAEIATSSLLRNAGAGLALHSEGDFTLSLAGDTSNNHDLAGNPRGPGVEPRRPIRLPLGVTCWATATSVDVASKGVPANPCDVTTDGACQGSVGVDAALHCWSDSTGAGCD